MEKAGLKIFGNSGSENTIETRKTGKKIKRGPGNIIDFLSTAAAINSLTEDQIPAIFARAIASAHKRSIELANE